MADGTVLIVGGTGGLGRELAAHYADRGRHVIITGRDEGKAKEIASELGGNLSAIGFDLAAPESIADALRKVGEVEPAAELRPVVAGDREALRHAGLQGERPCEAGRPADVAAGVRRRQARARARLGPGSAEAAGGRHGDQQKGGGSSHTAPAAADHVAFGERRPART